MKQRSTDHLRRAMPICVAVMVEAVTETASYGSDLLMFSEGGRQHAEPGDVGWRLNEFILFIPPSALNFAKP